MTKINLIEAINQTLSKMLKEDKSIILLGQDIGVNGGVFRVTEGLSKKFPGRVIDTPISEGLMIGAGVGLGISGFKPIIEIQFSGFIYQGFHQIVTQVARLRNRSRGNYSVPMVIRAPFGGGVKALELHSESMESLYAAIPGLKVVIPSSPEDGIRLLSASIKDPDPVLFLEPKRIYHEKQELNENLKELKIGKAKILKQGEDISIISYGAMIKEVLIVSEELKKQGISVEVINLRTISPLDFETIENSVKKTGRCLIVSEAKKSFSVASEISAHISEKCLYNLNAPVRRVSAPDTIPPYYQLEKYYYPSKEQILQSCIELMRG